LDCPAATALFVFCGGAAAPPPYKQARVKIKQQQQQQHANQKQQQQPTGNNNRANKTHKTSKANKTIKSHKSNDQPFDQPLCRNKTKINHPLKNKTSIKQKPNFVLFIFVLFVFVCLCFFAGQEQQPLPRQQCVLPLSPLISNEERFQRP